VKGLPPLSGWAVKYVSGMEGMPDIESGDFLSQWHVGANDVVFNFEHGLHMCFNTEADAVQAADFLKGAEIMTSIVKVRD